MLLGWQFNCHPNEALVPPAALTHSPSPKGRRDLRSPAPPAKEGGGVRMTRLPRVVGVAAKLPPQHTAGKGGGDCRVDVIWFLV